MPPWNSEVVRVKIGNPAFCLADLTSVHFRDELQHVGDDVTNVYQAWTNQTSRKKWCQIARRTICSIMPSKAHRLGGEGHWEKDTGLSYPGCNIKKENVR